MRVAGSASWFVVAFALAASCAVPAGQNASNASSCPPEPTTLDRNGEPRNAAGHVRYCWPGEAFCYCDSDNDCYARDGYVSCTESMANDGGAVSCPPETTTLDRNGEPRNAAGHIRYCWPWEALCHCDSDNDCYAQSGYVPCTQRDAGTTVVDSGPRDTGVVDSGPPDTGVIDSGPRDTGVVDTGVRDAGDSGIACPPEPTTLDRNGEPRNAAGHIRYCWPWEAFCHCDSDNDCYARDGYVPCTRAMDAGTAVDSGGTGTLCPPEPTTPDRNGEPRNAAGDIRYCWPGEAFCHCDIDNDCYAQPGYVPCSSRDAGTIPTDSGTAPMDSGTPPVDSGTSVDAGSPPDSGGTSGSNPIPAENLRTGTDAWTIAHAAGSHEVEGYASATSVAPGETFTLYVNVNSTHAVRWEAYRLGWYQGHGARLVASSSNRTISPQPACPVDSVTGLIECHWAPAFTVTPDASWVTGQYLFKLVRDDGYDIYVPLVVREATPRAPLVFQASVTTYQAYNRWGGNSLYVNQQLSGSFTGPHAYRVSFDRPYEVDSLGSGEVRRYEIDMIRWLEQHGYDVAYVTNIDVDADTTLLPGRRMFLSVGHDEYWSTGERNNVERARDLGVSLGFFSANTSYWKVRIEPSTDGRPGRVVTGYKDLATIRDPRRPSSETTTMWRDPLISRPENSLIGVMYELWANTDAFPFIVTNPSHWIYAGTGVAAGDTLTHNVGYEWDHVFDNGLTPPSLEIVAESWGVSHDGINAPAHTTVYYPTSSSIVFATGSIEWSWGLSRPGYADSRIGRITQNVLARAGVNPTVGVTVDPVPTPTNPGSATSVSLLAGTGVAGYVDGAATSARFDAPAGVAALADGTVYVTDQRNHRVRRISSTGAVTTLAGCGPTGATRSNRFSDGTGSAACFDVPTGIVVRADGTVLVSDTWNHRIRAITPAGVVTTFAGNGNEGNGDSSSPLNASFRYPRGLALGSDGSVYVADSGNGAVRRISTSGAVSTVVSGFYEPVGVGVTSGGVLYVTDSATATVWRVSGGTRTLAAGADSSFGDLEGAALSARLRPSDGVAVMGSTVVFADGANERVRALTLDSSPRVYTLAGNGTAGTALGTGASARFSLPRGIALYGSGVVVADSANNRVVYVRP